jgi:hypothetical protein
MQLPSSQPTADVVADADYFEAKARLCFRLANRATDDADKVTLVSLAHGFEERAWTLRETEV